MQSRWIYPEKPRSGDRVAILSPSSGLPGMLPLPFELGLGRLREDFGLEPVEYPTTRRMGSTAADRAADVNAAFADPTIRAVISSIGGDDQILVLPHLDGDLIRANPKPFFGYSDNTNLLAYLWQLGIVAYHGGSVMVQFGRPGAMHPMTADSLRAALFSSGPYDLRETDTSGDVDRPWDDPATFDSEPAMEPAEGWHWHNDDRVVEGPAWGGNLEILSWLLMAQRCIGPSDAHAGGIFFFETSEEMPEAREVYRVLRSMGERGMFGAFAGVMVGRPKAWQFTHRTTPEQKLAYRRAQREAVMRALTEYAPEAPAAFDVDFGHTDPQLVIPMGGTIRIDGPARRITVTY